MILLNRFLSKSFKVKLVKIPNQINKEEIIYNPHIDNRIVEFIGPPAVGKSTMCRSFVIANSDLEFVTKHQLYKLFENEYQLKNEIPKEFELLLNLKLDVVQSGKLTSIEKINFLDYFKKVVTIELLMGSHKFDSPILLDEGLFHNFSDEIISSFDDKKNICQILGNRSFVFLKASPEFIFENYIKRKKINGTRFYMGSNDYEVKMNIKNAIERIDQFKIYFNRLNVPFIVLESEEDMNFNLKRIKEFIIP